MHGIRINYKVLSIVLALCLILILFKLSSRGEPDILQKFGLKDFQASEKSSGMDVGISFTKLTATDQKHIVKVAYTSHIISAQAKQYIDENLFSIDSLYQTTQSPYPDVITRTIECPTKFKPVFNKTETSIQDSFYYVLYANDRFAYGICSEDLIKYHAVFSIVYCKSEGELYKLEVFGGPKEAMDKFIDKLQTFQC